MRVGGLHVGVRSSRRELHRLVCGVLGDHLVDDPDAPDNFSLQLAGHDPEQSNATFHFLYRGFTPVVRTTDPRRLVGALVAFLAGLLPDGRDRGLLVDAVALAGGGRAVLAPPDMRHLMASMERRLNRGGLRLVDRPWVALDPATGELVVEEPALEVDRSAIDEGLASLPTPRRADPPAGPGRYRLAGWAFGLGPDRAGALAPGEAVVEGCKLVLNGRSLGGQGVLDGVSRALEGATAAALWTEKPEALARPLLDLAG